MIVLQIKTVIEEVLVLEELSGSQGYFVSRKASLLDSKHNLPKTVEDVKAEEILPGYIASANDSGVFVRFLGGLTGRCGEDFMDLCCKEVLALCSACQCFVTISQSLTS